MPGCAWCERTMFRGTASWKQAFWHKPYLDLLLL
jgi:hypothetical protein